MMRIIAIERPYKLRVDEKVSFEFSDGKRIEGKIASRIGRYYVELSDGNSNSKVFLKLGLDANEFVEKIVGYKTSGSWPEVKSLEDLAKVLAALSNVNNVKKLKQIIRNSSTSVTFKFDDDSTITNTIDGYSDSSYLFHNKLNNAQVFYELGIDDPEALYEDLGILTQSGECPECKLEDLDKVFDYLLKHYSVKDEEPKKSESEKPESKEIKVSSEWDWILD